MSNERGQLEGVVLKLMARPPGRPWAGPQTPLRLSYTQAMPPPLSVLAPARVQDDMDDAPARPSASQLGAKQLTDELERRGLRATGFSGEDAQRLQVALDAEYDAEQAARALARAQREAQRRKDEEAARLARCVKAWSCTTAG